MSREYVNILNILSRMIKFDLHYKVITDTVSHNLGEYIQTCALEQWI